MQNRFRVWDKKLNKWLFRYNYGSLGGFNLWGETVLFGLLSTISLSRLNNLVIDTFTGIKDCFGKDIYENDIIDINSEKFVIQFDKGCFLFVMLKNKKLFNVYYHFNKNQLKNLKIIGNIHENSELLN